MYRIESLLSARTFASPQVAGERIYFLSNMSGHLSLYAMNTGGSVPEPLLPPHLALQNPHLMDGLSFYVFAKLGKIVVMLDHDGDENYQPMLIPLAGGFPEPAFGDYFAKYRSHLVDVDVERGWLYFSAESRSASEQISLRANLESGAIEELYSSPYGGYPMASGENMGEVILAEGYTTGDVILLAWREGELHTVYGVPINERTSDTPVVYSGITNAAYSPNERGLLALAAIYEDTYSLVYIALDKPDLAQRVTVAGVQHSGAGEMVNLSHLEGDRYSIEYNIDGVSWLYEGRFDQAASAFNITRALVGTGQLANGVLLSHNYEKATGRFVISFCTATTPTQIYLRDGDVVQRQTNERVLGIPADLLSPGEDASFITYDGMRISARLYLPAEKLGFTGPRPVVVYVHGGPQGQERPDFSWFSMPLIQMLTLRGMAVFVPNVRGSTGYGLEFTRQVDHDWGGKDRLDHVHALSLLAADPRLDVSRAGVVGRSYGGYMTLTLAARHPELWSAAVDMFGPFDLLSFSERIPETWKPYFKMALGDPDIEQDRAFLVERSPKTHIDQITCPLLVIQGANDPRVVLQESRDLVEHLKQTGKPVELLVFDNEGHDVLKYENRVRCYNEITAFFEQHLLG